MNAIELQKFSSDESKPMCLSDAREIIMSFRSITDPVSVIKLFRKINQLEFRVHDQVIDKATEKHRYYIVSPDTGRRFFVGEFFVRR